MAGIRDWAKEQARRKWIWAGHVARRTDKRWTREVLEYHPVHGSRARGHPKTRWEDELDKFVWDSFCMPKGTL